MPNQYDHHTETSFIRQMGSLFGRIFATLCAAVTMRILSRDVFTDSGLRPRETNEVRSLIQEFQYEIPVAAATLLTWHAGIGGQTGANVAQYLTENIIGVTFNYFMLQRQPQRGFFATFTDQIYSKLSGFLSTPRF